MQDDLKLLKKRIYEEERVEQLLEELGCHSIKYEQSGTLITAGLPTGDNKRSVQVRLCEDLYSSIRSKGIDGDIYAVVGYVLYETRTFDEVRAKLHQIKYWIINVLEYDDFEFYDFDKPKPRVDWNWWLRPIQKERKKEIEVSKNPILDESVLSHFSQCAWMGWIDEGISIQTQKEFEIGISVYDERITIPIRNADGKLIGIKGRYIGNDKKIQESKKYMYIYPCSKSIELFNTHRAMPYIQEKRECIVVEGAKSVMHLYEWGIKNAVSIEGDKLSPVQAKLLKNLGIDVELVFAFDKDKDKEYVMNQIRQIKSRAKYIVIDEYGWLKDPKASPVDYGYDTWIELYKNKIKIS